ncbi:MAG: hypothetical protein ACR2JY_07235 [Chloroflexota bacterium]
MAERLVTLTQLRDNLDAIVDVVQRGETVVLVNDEPGQPPTRRVVLIAAAAYARLAPPEHDKAVEATVGGVAGGLVAGTGTTLSSLTGNPVMAKSARKLGRRVGRALAAGMDALNEPKK